MKTYIRNDYYDRVIYHNPVAGLPLFDETKLPPKTIKVSFTKVKSLKSLDPDYLNKQQQLVLNAIRILGEASDRDIAEFLGIERSSIIPRRNELQKKGKIKLAGEKLDLSNKTVAIYKLKEY